MAKRESSRVLQRGSNAGSGSSWWPFWQTMPDTYPQAVSNAYRAQLNARSSIRRHHGQYGQTGPNITVMMVVTITGQTIRSLVMLSAFVSMMIGILCDGVVMIQERVMVIAIGMVVIAGMVIDTLSMMAIRDKVAEYEVLMVRRRTIHVLDLINRRGGRRNVENQNQSD
jgi:hypothetical protein